jgi:hypothetical protein
MAKTTVMFSVKATFNAADAKAAKAITKELKEELIASDLGGEVKLVVKQIKE